MTDRTRLPAKLKNDAILEAVLEIRIEPDVSLVPEVFIGRFAGNPRWGAFRQARLATADIPAPVRRINPALKYMPSVGLTSGDGTTVLRVGPHVVAYSRRGAYPGWDESFRAELHDVADHLYGVLPDVLVSRVGLRYLNVLRSDLHGIGSIADLPIKIAVSEKTLTNRLNLNFKTIVNADFETMSRVASVDLAEGIIPENATVIVDIDAYTSGIFKTTSVGIVKDRIIEAHDHEKVAFFDILGESNTERLRER